ncbi:MAG: DUF192 domain-containing protein [Candidatus Micrarchaeota archaeon]
MKAYEMAALFAIAVLIILFIHLATAKGEKRRITLVNSQGQKLDIDAEIANESATMAKGLMGRKSLGENEGMLFVFPKSGIYPFWMVNTTIPLDAIHIAENGTVVDILEMEPCGLNITKCRLYTPKAPAKYVLEVNKGYSKKNKIINGNSTMVFEAG